MIITEEELPDGARWCCGGRDADLSSLGSTGDRSDMVLLSEDISEMPTDERPMVMSPVQEVPFASRSWADAPSWRGRGGGGWTE